MYKKCRDTQFSNLLSTCIYRTSFPKIICRKSLRMKARTEKSSEKAKANFFDVIHPFYILQKFSRKREYQSIQKNVFWIFSAHASGMQEPEPVLKSLKIIRRS